MIISSPTVMLPHRSYTQMGMYGIFPVAALPCSLLIVDDGTISGDSILGLLGGPASPAAPAAPPLLLALPGARPTQPEAAQCAAAAGRLIASVSVPPGAASEAFASRCALTNVGRQAPTPGSQRSGGMRHIQERHRQQ